MMIKKMSEPLAFQDSLKSFKGHLRQKFSKNVLNFSYRLLNISELNIRGKKIKGLISRPILFILQNIWQLNEEKVKELFKLGETISWSKRKQLVDKVVDYIRSYDPNFSWKVLQEIEAQTIKQKEERVMPPLQYSLDKAREEGMQKGILQGIQKGEQKGRQEERQQVILNMLKNKMDTDLICKATGLSKAEIKKLQKKHS